MPDFREQNFRIDKFAMRYSNFVPRLFNFCLSLGLAKPVQSLNTARAYRAAEELVERIGADWPTQRTSIGRHLHAGLFSFRHDTTSIAEASHNINRNLIRAMPQILSSRYPLHRSMHRSSLTAPSGPSSRRGPTAASAWCSSPDYTSTYHPGRGRYSH